MEKLLKPVQWGILKMLKIGTKIFVNIWLNKKKIELTERHWDVINHLRDEFFNNAGNQPNTRKLVKFFEKKWGEKIDAKVLYDLFPGDPSKQGGRISGLPESRRKGGY